MVDSPGEKERSIGGGDRHPGGGGVRFKVQHTHLELQISIYYWLVVSTPLKNISQIGPFPQVGVKIKIFETTT